MCVPIWKCEKRDERQQQQQQQKDEEKSIRMSGQRENENENESVSKDKKERERERARKRHKYMLIHAHARMENDLTYENHSPSLIYMDFQVKNKMFYIIPERYLLPPYATAVAAATITTHPKKIHYIWKMES